MTKTTKMATIAQYNRQTNRYTHVDRRVFKNESGNYYVRINGDWTSVEWLKSHGRKVDIWF